MFRNVTQGSYLLDIHCATHAFAPLRVDVSPILDGALEDGVPGHGEVKLEVKAWETYRGNDWGNKGEEAPRQKLGNNENGVVFGAKVLGEKGYFMERSKCEFSVCLMVEYWLPRAVLVMMMKGNANALDELQSRFFRSSRIP